MKIRKKIYGWYILTIILSISLFLSSEHVNSQYTHQEISVSQVILFILITTVPILLFLEYSILLRIYRINKYAKEERAGNPMPFSDFGSDELTEIVEHLNDQSSLIGEKTSKIKSFETIVKTLFKESPIMNIHIDINGSIKFFNDNAKKYLEKDSPNKNEDGNFFRLFSLKNKDLSIDKILSSTTLNRSCGRLISKDSSGKWILWIYKTNFDNHKKAESHSLIGVDITNIKVKEEKLKTIVKNISSIVIRIDSSGNIDYASSGIVDIMEFSTLPSHINDMILKISESKPGVIERMIEDCQNSNKTCRSYRKIKIYNVLENKYRWYEIIVKKDSYDGMIITIDDAEAIVTKSKKQEKNRIMNEFIYDSMSDLTSNDLKDVGPSINLFIGRLKNLLSSDFTGLYIDIDDFKDLVIESNDGNDIDIDIISALKRQGDNDFKDFSIFEISDPDIPSDLFLYMKKSNIHSLIMSKISFNHTHIGFIFSGVYNRSFHVPEWDDVDGAAIRISGRIIGTVLRPVIKSDNLNLNLEDILK